MIASKSLAIVRGQPARYSLMAFPGSSSSSCRRNMSTLVRFKENERLASSASHEKLEQKLQDGAKSPTDPKITANELEELRYKEPGQNMYYPSSEISPRSAELRADLGKAADLWQSQVFDGPAPETINSRLAMLGVLIGLIGEWTTGLGLMQQTADHPITVFAIFLLITFASYIPIARGFTRKEPYANHLLGFDWTPRAENWNGRVAMMGFAGMCLTEWLTGVNTLQAWGLQSVPFLHV